MSRKRNETTIPAWNSIGELALGPEDVAASLKCSPRVAARLMREGKIVSRKVGRSWRTIPEAVSRYLAGTEGQK